MNDTHEMISELTLEESDLDGMTTVILNDNAVITTFTIESSKAETLFEYVSLLKDQVDEYREWQEKEIILDEILSHYIPDGSVFDEIFHRHKNNQKD